jgi:hypothetical protein
MGVEFHNCNMAGANWKNLSLYHCYFNGGNFKLVKNASATRGLLTVRADGFATEFEMFLPRLIDRVDWEQLNRIGRLPVFAASSVALIAFPIFFYLLDTYNQHIDAWRSVARLGPDPTVSLSQQFLWRLAERLPSLPVPALSLISLFRLCCCLLLHCYLRSAVPIG